MQQSGCFTVRMQTVCGALLGGAALLAGVAQAAKPEAPKQALGNGVRFTSLQSGKLTGSGSLTPAQEARTSRASLVSC